MKPPFEELAYRATSIGDLSLRRRTDLATGRDIHEVKLGDDFLMSSQYVDGEVALADLGLAAAQAGPLDVVVGGLGLGYTAKAALDFATVRSVVVVDALADVIDWHRRHLVPLGEAVADDPRCRLVHGDFFALAADPAAGFVTGEPGRRFDAILLDIDHSPRNVLHPGNSALYTPQGLTALAGHLRPGGVFALWSNDAEDDDFMAVMGGVFDAVAAHDVTILNTPIGVTASNLVYTGRRRG
ncbi:MAG: spermidine synthase [Rhodospirillaceae bacterium BRH_c57]|nr:MAG: spermidine synthase [Rhodospirillaceae bacterium BRH_c57]